MEEDEDDFYGGGGAAPQQNENVVKPDDFEGRDTHMDDGEDQGDDEEDSDDDVQFTLEKPPGAATEETPTKSRTSRQRPASQERATSTDRKVRQASPAVKAEPRTGSAAPPAAVRGALTYDGKEGKDFPEVRTSKIDVNHMPVWPANGKPITEVDLDADIAEESRLWRIPGTDQTDFFNYGFDEYTWAQYCLRQQSVSNTISEQKEQDAQMKAMFGGGGAPGMNGAVGANAGMPPGMPSMPGLPNPDEMFRQFMNSGMMPNDSDQFMQMMMSGAMPNMPGGGPQGQPNQQQQGGGGFGGQNQNTGSPHQPSGMGFQPPQGPSHQNQQGDQGGFGANAEGYSAQQLAIMQQQQGGQGGGRRGRRGRGYY